MVKDVRLSFYDRLVDPVNKSSDWTSYKNDDGEFKVSRLKLRDVKKKHDRSMLHI